MINRPVTNATIGCSEKEHGAACLHKTAWSPVAPCVGAALPDWVPTGARLYLSHTAKGLSLRALAREHGCHASTVLRQVRRFENRRDDPLVDDALTRLDRALRRAAPPNEHGASAMAQTILPGPRRERPACSTEDLLHVLRSLTGPARSLSSPRHAQGNDPVRPGDGRTERWPCSTARLAEMLALKDWITCRRTGRVRSYTAKRRGLRGPARAG